jgi:hypothetical protein
MKKIFFLIIICISSQLAFTQTSRPVNVMTLNGTWDLYENSNGTIGNTPDQSMNIMTFDGNKIVVQGISPGNTYWIGLGELRGSEGYFDWRFNDGRYGQTTFKVDKNGNLDALSLSFTVEYKYLAKRSE